MDTHAADRALADLLLAMFSADELRRFLRYGPRGDVLDRSLPGPTASPAALVDEAVGALRRHGAVDDALFDRLVAERPRRAGEINRVRGMLGAAETALPLPPVSAPGAPARATPVTRPVKIFLSYAHADEALRDVLVKHLGALRRQGLVDVWHDRQIRAGDAWRGAIDRHIDDADIILLLVSADFIDSDYCYDVEMKRAMERHAAHDARVIPVFVRACDWSGAPFGALQGVPDPARPISAWPDKDEAWTLVARAIRGCIVAG